MPNAVEPPSESPANLEAAYVLLADGTEPPWRPVAGGTDLMVQVTGEIGEPPERVLDIWGLDELRGISVDADALVLGALTTYTEIRQSPLVAEFLPALVEAGVERTVPADAFWPAYRTTPRRADELLIRVRIPLARDRQVRFQKIGTRRAQAISKVVMALAWRATNESDPWTGVRLALGSVAATTVRAPATEAVLEDARPTRETADAAAAALVAEIAPIDDVRSTADYRRTVAGRVLHRLIRDAGGW